MLYLSSTKLPVQFSTSNSFAAVVPSSPTKSLPAHNRRFSISFARDDLSPRIRRFARSAHFSPPVASLVTFVFPPFSSSNSHRTRSLFHLLLLLLLLYSVQLSYTYAIRRVVGARFRNFQWESFVSVGDKWRSIRNDLLL